MEIFFDRMDEENSKTQRRNGRIKKIHKNKKERMEGIFYYFYVRGGSHTCVFSIGRKCP